MNIDLVALFGPGAATVLGVALLQATWKWIDNRRVLRRGQSLTDAQWNNAYRRGAEAHLVWDGEAMAAIRELQYEINLARRERGESPREFTVIRTPPPLFPIWEPDQGSN